MQTNKKNGVDEKMDEHALSLAYSLMFCEEKAVCYMKGCPSFAERVKAEYDRILECKRLIRGV